jgi:hypothetical protein
MMQSVTALIVTVQLDDRAGWLRGRLIRFP